MSKIFNDKQLKDLEKKLSKISGRKVSVSVVKKSEKITHEEAKNELATFRGIADYSYNHLWLYIKQQEKQEKLLELYKEYFEYSEMLKDGRKFGGRMLVEHERDKIIEQIKELENEFK